MFVTVTRLRIGGVAIGRERLGAEPRARGCLRVEERMDAAVRRTVRVARLTPNTAAREGDILEPLRDATLLWMDGRGFVLSGVEDANGRLFAQAWWCRPWPGDSSDGGGS